MILLTSNGLSSDKLLITVQNEVTTHNFEKAVIIVTADNEYKRDNWHIERLTEELKGCGLSVDFFDFDTDNPDVLYQYDVIEINGGNPFYLLDRMRKANAKPFLESHIKAGKMIIGISAGSVVLQKDIEIVNIYSSEMNFLELSNLDGLGLVNATILPHYSKFVKRFDCCEERCKEYESRKDVTVIRLNDGDGIIISDSIETIIGVED